MSDNTLKHRHMNDFPSAKSPLSVFIVCCNEEKKIERCLQSVSFAQEIIVVDSGSSDRTIEICKKYTDKVIHKNWAGFVEQKTFAFARCSNEWVLNLDADEEISDPLRARISAIVAGKEDIPADLAGFQISRVVNYMGRWWIKGGWYPEYRLRLVRKSKTAWGGTDPHEHAIPDGRTKRIKEQINHYTYSNLREQVQSLNSLSSSAAFSLYKNGRTTSFISIMLRPLARFFKFYFAKRGFLEGQPGLIVALMESFYTFLKYAKLWELQRSNHASSDSNH